MTKNTAILRGKNIVVTRARGQASEFAVLLKAHGANVLCCPTIRVLEPASFQPLDHAIKRLDFYDWLIFTSVNGVEMFNKRFKKFFDKGSFPKHLKTCAIGPATAEKMRKFRIPVTKISQEYVAESILKEIPEVSGRKILLPTAADAREVLPKEFRRRGAQVDVVVAYRTALDQSNFSKFRKWFKNKQVNCVTFTASSTVKNFFSLLSSYEKDKLVENQGIQTASIGPITTMTLKKLGWAPAIIAAKPTIQHLAKAIVNFYEKKLP